MANKEGHVGASMTDALKDVCERCNGSEFYISLTYDDVNDWQGAAAALGLSIAGGIISALTLMCVQCGFEQTRIVQIIDRVKTVAAAAITMEHLDSSVANSLAGYFVIVLGGTPTDVLKVYTIASNTAAAPTVITLTVAPNADLDEDLVLITKFTTEHTAGS